MRAPYKFIITYDQFFFRNFIQKLNPITDLKVPGDGVDEGVGLADAPEVDGVAGADQALVEGVDYLQ